MLNIYIRESQEWWRDSSERMIEVNWTILIRSLFNWTERVPVGLSFPVSLGPKFVSNKTKESSAPRQTGVDTSRMPHHTYMEV